MCLYRFEFPALIIKNIMAILISIYVYICMLVTMMICTVDSVCQGSWSKAVKIYAFQILFKDTFSITLLTSMVKNLKLYS